MPQKKNKKTIAFVLIIALAIIGLAIYFFLIRNGDANTSVIDQDGIVYEQATEAEKQESEQNKDRIAQQVQDAENNQQSPDAGGQRKVVPIMSAWGQATAGANFTINGYVQEVIESDGSCTVTMEKDGIRLTESKKAFANAQNTSCGQISVPYSKLSNGSWNVTLSYASTTASGSSAPITVEVK